MKVIEQLKNKSIKKKGIDGNDALRLSEEASLHPFVLMAAAGEIRDHFHGRRISLCGSISAKSGRCGEDCAFCARAKKVYKKNFSSFPLKRDGEIIAAAQQAAREGAEFFGIAAGGRTAWTAREWEKICRTVSAMQSLEVQACASLGVLTAAQAAALKAAGLHRYHHNLLTSRSYFPQVCTTRGYEEDMKTVLLARRAGLSVCAGGIIGLGEGMTHRVELALTIRELGVESVPIRILTPVSGTPLGGRPPLSPLEILITIALWRFLLPDRELRICGGRGSNLRRLLPLGIIAGANALMRGHDRAHPEEEADAAREMIRDLGCHPAREPLHVCKCMTACHQQEGTIEKSRCP